LKSQIVISSWGGLRRAVPYAFTEEGVAMVSSVLNSQRAIKVNVEIMRALFGYGKSLPPMPSWLVNLKSWRKSMIPNLGWSLKPFAN